MSNKISLIIIVVAIIGISYFVISNDKVSTETTEVILYGTIITIKDQDGVLDWYQITTNYIQTGIFYQFEYPIHVLVNGEPHQIDAHNPNNVSPRQAAGYYFQITPSNNLSCVLCI